MVVHLRLLLQVRSWVLQADDDGGIRRALAGKREMQMVKVKVLPDEWVPDSTAGYRTSGSRM